MRIKPSRLSGNVCAIGAKAHAHRLLFLGALCEEATKITNLTYSDDVLATLDVLACLGVDISKNGSEVTIRRGKKQAKSRINVKESGTTLRLILPLLSYFSEETEVIAEGRLPKRPIKTYLEVMKEGGMLFSAESLPFIVKGSLSSQAYHLPGDISSQYFSGLLLAGAGLANGLTLHATSDIESKPYIDLTCQAMSDFGVSVDSLKNGYYVSKSTYQSPKTIAVESDWSNIAPWLVSGALSGEGICASGLNRTSMQGDKAILAILEAYGASVSYQDEAIVIKKDKKKPLQLDMSQIPDLLPVLAILAAGAEGKSVFYNAKRLRYKETDRLERVALLINQLGGKAMVEEDSLIIYGKGYLAGGRIDVSGDHRLVMAGAISSVIAKDTIEMIGQEAINKSYPNFFEIFRLLGGII